MPRLFTIANNLLEKEKPLFILWTPVILAAGITYAIKQETTPSSILIILLIAYLFLAFSQKDSRLIILPPILFFGAFFFMTYRLNSNDTRLLTTPMTATLEARILDIDEKPKTISVLLDQIDLLGTAEPFPFERIQISLRQKDSLEPGDRIRLSVQLLPPSRPVITGGFDLRTHARSKHISAYGFSIAPAGLIEKTTSPNIKLAQWRHFISKKIDSYRPKSAETSITKALLIGKRAAIPEATLDALRISGLSHILAISGFHIGLAALGSYLLISRFLLIFEHRFPYFQNHKAAAIGALGIAFLYMIFAGASITTQRAFIMTFMVLLALLLDRRAISIHLVMLAATLLLILHPASLFTPGFQMSFSAVIALIAFYQSTFRKNMSKKLRDRLESHNALARNAIPFLLGIILTSSIASLATLPLTLFHFGTGATYSVLANIIGLPIVTFLILPFSILSLILMPFGLETPALAIASWGNHLLITYAERISTLPHAQWRLPSADAVGISILFFGVLWISLWRSLLRYGGIIFIFIGVFLAWGVQPIPSLILSEDGQVFAISGDGKNWVFGGKKSSYTTQQWQNALGLHKNNIHSRANPPKDIFCTSAECSISKDGERIVIVTEAGKEASYCLDKTIRILILLFPAQTSPFKGECLAPHHIIHRDDLEAEGAHSLYFKKNQWIIHTAEKSIFSY